MKALVLNDKGNPLQLQTVADPVAEEGESIVEIFAAALNHRDVWIRKGIYANLSYPVILGSDGCGKVLSVGSKADQHWEGKVVIINPSLQWGTALTHQHPDNFRILGMPDNGTFAQLVKVPVINLAEKPEHLSFEEAAAIPLAALTAYRGLLKRAALTANEKVLITGIGGGVALFALQFALAANAEVFVTSGSNEKIQSALTLGAAGGSNYKEEKWADHLLAQAGNFDVIIDGAAGEGFNHLLNLAAPGGRVVIYGATRGNIDQIQARRIFWKQLSILGSTMGSPRDFHEMTGFVKAHKIKPVMDKIFPFEEGNAALNRMDDGEQFGKIIISIKQNS
jgi:NADPH:quinone reductase-like Zn-dependent oxidoreductase